MPSNGYQYEQKLIRDKLFLIDRFAEFIRHIRDTRYIGPDKTEDDLFFEFYPIWERAGKKPSKPQRADLDNRKGGKFVNSLIEPIQSKGSHSNKSGKQNTLWFLTWLHAYHEDKAKEWYKIVCDHYRAEGDTDTISDFAFQPFEGEPPAFEDTDLAKDWGLAPKEESKLAEVVSTVKIAFTTRDKVFLALILLLAASTALFWYRDARTKEQYALAAEEPRFNVLYLDVDHLGRDQFDRIRNGEVAAPDDDELYSQMFGLPVVNFNLHENLRDALFNDYEAVTRELETADSTCLIGNAPDEYTARTNTLFLVLQSIGGSPAYDVRLNMQRISLPDRTLFNADSYLYPEFVQANDRRGLILPRGADLNKEISEEVTISLGDLMVADGRLIELEAYSYVSARHGTFGDRLPCDSDVTAPAYRDREIRISVPTEYVAVSLTYRTVLGEEVTQEIRKPNRTPVLLSRGVIIHG